MKKKLRPKLRQKGGPRAQFFLRHVQILWMGPRVGKRKRKREKGRKEGRKEEKKRKEKKRKGKKRKEKKKEKERKGKEKAFSPASIYARSRAGAHLYQRAYACCMSLIGG